MSAHQQIEEPTTARGSERDDAPVTTAKDIHPDRSLFAEAITIARSPSDLFAFWRDPLNLLEIMPDIQSIAPIDRDRSTWTVKGPGGKHYTWESIVTHEVPDREITWQSAPGADVANSGRVEFREAGPRGTVVRVVTAYDPPGGVIGRTIAKILQREPRLQTRRNLRRLKQLMECGEIATSARNRRQQAERRESMA